MDEPTAEIIFFLYEVAANQPRTAERYRVRKAESLCAFGLSGCAAPSRCGRLRGQEGAAAARRDSGRQAGGRRRAGPIRAHARLGLPLLRGVTFRRPRPRDAAALPVPVQSIGRAGMD